jgi:hypothetical protein
MAIISLQTTNWFVLIAGTECVYNAVRAEFKFSLQRINEWKSSAVRRPFDIASPGVSTIMWILQSRQSLSDLLFGMFTQHVNDLSICMCQQISHLY